MLFALLALSGCGGSSSEAVPPVPTAAAHTTRLTVDGMTCASCADQIAAALAKRPGIVDVAVDVEGGSATVRHDPALISADQVAAAVTEVGYPARLGADTPAAAAADPVFGVDPEVAKICQAGCAAQFDFDPADVVAQPGAKAGDLTRCPVSGVVFVVKEDQPHYDVDGRTWYTCCGMCLGKLQEDPKRFLRM